MCKPISFIIYVAKEQTQSAELILDAVCCQVACMHLWVDLINIAQTCECGNLLRVILCPCLFQENRSFACALLVKMRFTA